ncbi:MAG: TIR domain-containing protein [Pseudomonadales bacterium]|nr:TIR domain-containing protein [Pseudomonadales bacterium]
MERPFPAYEGDQPYIFVCYSHVDKELVYPELVWLGERGCNIWYDEGITPGEEWSEELGHAIEGASQFLFFATPAAVDSRNCRDELRFALDLEKDIVSVHLKETQLTSGIRLSIGAKQAIFKYELAEQEYRDKLLSGLRVHDKQTIEDPQSSRPAASSINSTKPILFAGGLIALAILAVGILLFLRPSTDTPSSDDTPVPESAANAQQNGNAEPATPSIAVLPFTNMSSDPDQVFFSDGISEEILNTLVKTNTLPVIARTSSFKFRGEEFDAKEIGEKLKVSHLLEGSVRKSGNQVRIAAQLIDTSTGVHLWSDSYNRDITDIFAVQVEIAHKIVNHIGIALPTGKDINVGQSSRVTENQQAYELFLKAKHLANTGNPFEVEKAIPLYEQALQLDGRFADAWADLGIAYAELGDVPLALRIPTEVYPIAIEAFRTALEIDPKHARAMGYLGYSLIQHEYQWNEGLQLLQQSVAMNPQDARLQAMYGWILYFTNHPDAATVLERAYLLNPFDLQVVFTKASQLVADGRYGDGATLMDTALIQNRNRYDANLLAAAFNISMRRLDIAEGYLAKARAVVGADYPTIRAEDYLVALMSGDQLRANALKTELLELAKHTRVGWLSNLTPGSDENQLKQIYDIATDQRHPETLFWLLVKPPWIADSDWAKLQEKTRAAEANITPRILYGRSDEDKARLRSEAALMTSDELDSYVGVFENENGEQIRIERDSNQLRLDMAAGSAQLVPVGNDHFDDLEVKVSYNFIVEDGNVTQLEVLFRQVTYTYIKKGE